MHILIDKERMAFLAKHKSVEVLANLAWIEAHETPVALFPIDVSKHFSQFTELELRTLYNTTTGEEFPQNRYDALIHVLYDLACRMPETNVNAFEAEAQAQYIKDDVKHRYQYVRGSTKPARKTGLFEPEPVKMSRNENEELMALNGHITVQQHTKEKAQTKKVSRTLPTEGSGHAEVTVSKHKTRGEDAPQPETGSDDKPQAKPKPTPKPKTPKAGTGSSQGSKKAIIWAVAQGLWEDAGKPTDVKEILPIRKQAMAILETEHGIAKTTSSTSLGGWQKDILS